MTLDGLAKKTRRRFAINPHAPSAIAYVTRPAERLQELRRGTRRLRRAALVEGDGCKLHGLAAATRAGLIRIVEHELRRELLGLEVHFGAEQEQHRLRIDQNLDALVLAHT